MSIKRRITLWYTCFLVVLTALMLIGILMLAGNALATQTKDVLTKVVQDNADEVEHEDGELDLEDVDSSKKQVNIYIYSEDGELLFGKPPSIFPTDIAFVPETIQTIEGEGENWYVYDYLETFKKYDSVWVRGIIPINSLNETMQIFLRFSLIILPLLVLIAALGGYIIVRRALLPVDTIMATVNDINHSGDLSRRVPVKQDATAQSGRISHDEITKLSYTFNALFDRLEAMFQKERQFTSDASHELRTPVTVIMSECEYALMPACPSGEVRESLDEILNQSRKISALITQLLTLTRADNQKIQLEPECFNICDLADVVMKEMKEEADRKDISLTAHMPQEIQVSADRMLMTRLLMNVISNAICYGREHGHIIVTARSEGQELLYISIADDGIGIQQAHLPKIWDRFYQVDTSRNKSIGSHGCGLGLSMVKMIVELHHGTCSVESTPDSGTTFTFSLPVVYSTDQCADTPVHSINEA